jgi:hypothetical protein
MQVESALKPLLDQMSITLFETCSTENSKGKAGRRIRRIDLEVLPSRKFTSAFLSEKYKDIFSFCKVKAEPRPVSRHAGDSAAGQ